MKLIFITREGYRLPGARVRCYNFARELNKYGVHTRVLSYADTLGAQDGEDESRMGLVEKIRHNYAALKILAQDKDAVLYMQRFNYHSLAPYAAHLLYKHKIILDLDDWEMRDNPEYHWGFYPSSKAHFCIRHIARRSLACIAASRFLEAFLSGFTPHVQYIPTGVDTALFRPPPHRLDREKIIFSWIGTFHKKEYIENIAFALQCFSLLRQRYPHIYFEIAGDGIHRSCLLEIIRSYQDNHIIVKGWIAPAEVPAYLAHIHIGLMPVLSDNKFNNAKSPTKLFEYMAMAKPTVSSGIGENIHIIRDADNGFLAKGKDEFIQKMQRLIEDADLCVRMGQRARSTVESDYSLEISGRRLYAALTETPRKG
jgi:glycosyltransferase involved in cell wall biosynthesis